MLLPSVQQRDWIICFPVRLLRQLRLAFWGERGGAGVIQPPCLVLRISLVKNNFKTVCLCLVNVSGMGRRCVFGCANYRNLFPFPLDPCLRKKWIEFTHFEEGGLCPNSRICDRHFSEEVFDNLGMYTSGMAAHLRLSEDAIPLVYTVGASPVKVSSPT